MYLWHQDECCTLWAAGDGHHGQHLIAMPSKNGMWFRVCKSGHQPVKHCLRSSTRGTTSELKYAAEHTCYYKYMLPFMLNMFLYVC